MKSELTIKDIIVMVVLTVICLTMWTLGLVVELVIACGVVGVVCGIAKAIKSVKKNNSFER